MVIILNRNYVIDRNLKPESNKKFTNLPCKNISIVILSTVVSFCGNAIEIVILDKVFILILN